MKYILGIDQSTQGTKAILFDAEGNPVKRADVPHRQIINARGWVSHDPEEIYRNTLQAVRDVVKKAGVSKADMIAMGISNQRETTVLWNKEGKALADAVVWQCSRASDIAERMADRSDAIYEKTGMPLSPYFPACKMTWLAEHTEVQPDFHFGTVDSWLLYRLTEGRVYKTDYSNASRTQLMNLHTLQWDEELCRWFGISEQSLPQICDSNSCFGYTNLEGFLDHEIPILTVLGDSHGALFGQGCHEKGMVKTTYGTGSSIMMNIGENYVQSKAGLATSLAWGIDGKVNYVLEGNINYTGAVVTWLQEDMNLISSAEETQTLAYQANPADTSILVPAFTGLSAPYWKKDAKAFLWGMSRTTGRAEVVKAALDSIGYQIADVLRAMEQDSGEKIRELRVDGGPARNAYLMQFQSSLADLTVYVAEREELSAMGAAYLAGITAGLYRKKELFAKMKYRKFEPSMSAEERAEKRNRWEAAMKLVM